MVIIESLEIIALAIAASLDLFAVMNIEGAMLYEIDKKKVFKVSIFFGSWMALSLLLGNILMNKIIDIGIFETKISTTRIFLSIVASAIFLGLGIRMFKKSLEEDNIFERRLESINTKRIALLATITSIDEFLIGIGISLMDMKLNTIIIPIFVISIASVIAGIYIGYHFGYEQKRKAYITSTVILLTVGILLVIDVLKMIF